jgi:hypothetical protein
MLSPAVTSAVPQAADVFGSWIISVGFIGGSLSFASGLGSACKCRNDRIRARYKVMIYTGLAFGMRL